MRYSHHIIFTLLVISIVSLDWKPIEQAVEQAILDKAFPGCVIGVANKTHVLGINSYGHLTYSPTHYAINTANDTKYDVASMTKIMATTLAIMNLYSSQRIQLTDPVSKYIKDYDTNKKSNTTIANLLLHNAGLPYDYPGPLPSSQQEVLDYIRYLKPVTPVGSKFAYSNLGFLLLGKIVQNITNQSFQAYNKENRIFASLYDTGFNPSKQDFPRIAPTQFDQQIRKKIVRGQAHERLAYFFNGVAGHSGIFTTAPDVLRYMRILLNLGKIDGQVGVLPSKTVEAFINRVQLSQYENTRGYGFDTVCPSNKMKKCFGHDGSTGISGWVDRENGIAFVIMSNRGHPDVKNNKYFEKYKQKLSDAIMQGLQTNDKL